MSDYFRDRGTLDATGTDEELLISFVTGDADAFEALYDRHHTRLFRLSFSRVQSADLAEDIESELWLKFFIKAPDLADRCLDPDIPFQLAAYLTTMAVNACNDYHAHIHRHQNWEALQQALDLPNEEIAFAGLMFQRFLECLNDRTSNFPERYQKAFWLTRDRACSYSDAASLLGTETETAKDWIAQVLVETKMCREDLLHG